jgi:hypothetical protein
MVMDGMRNDFSVMVMDGMRNINLYTFPFCSAYPTVNVPTKVAEI